MNNSTKTILVILISVMLLTAAFGSGALVGATVRSQALDKLFKTPTSTLAPTLPTLPTLETAPKPQGQASSTPIPSELTPDEQKNLFKPFWESWKLLHENYVDQPLDDLILMRGAISGMLAATGDQHTSYMDPEQFTQANTSMEGEYEGIGAWVDTTGDYIQVISPMKGSPAELAGLKAKDIVIAIDDVDMTGTPGELALQRILGKAGTSVKLTVLRDNEKLDFTITRAKITVPVVESKMLDNGIAYVSLHTFNDQTMVQLRAALKELLAQDPKGLVFDLRDNGGGYLSTAIDVVSQFIPDGVVMYEKYGDGTRDTYTAKPGGLATKIKLAVLINEGSASASEITAGAIQDRGRGKLVGVTSYGKGSVQNWIPLTTEAGGVRITIARWLTPNGTQISGKGLTPDIEVVMTEEDYTNGLDPQLDAAANYL
ncbi:MAG TPA: S41 family peptidase, partial [Anaerolineaceae bacterium]|nr:S41 family peptidase [Anaerolineaceae bacterium]